ncbi:MAG TPA: type II toxin-antitoxin system RelE/ParE family toxin [Candidatus Acidoferrum sp.]|nr:type II toxin-antitoxin system RelE/ParE family toxin [Candidatus Acidoferrum sp.]HXR33818.1 type II toxin-antitoxin system RelE/ParE family toxin [Verrucomicrobiae bacterium]
MKKIAWSERARADIRRLDRSAAMRVFEALLRFAETDEGDIKKLQGDPGELRLRVGDYRVRFTEESDDTLRVHSVRHRKEAYR